MKTLRAVFPAILLASVVPAVAIALWTAVIAGSPGNAMFAFFGGFVVAAAHVLALGLPASVVLQKSERMRLIPMLLAGAAIGAVPTSLLVGWNGADIRFGTGLILISAAAALGSLGAACFYLALPND